MEKLIRKIDLPCPPDVRSREMLHRQWLITNGLGGYASGTVSGSLVWRYHGLLVAALPAPDGRVMLLNHLTEFVRLPTGEWRQLSNIEMVRDGDAQTCEYLTQFRLENQLPVWRYEVEDVVIEKQLVLLHGQNTVHVTYRLLSDHEGIQLQVRPFMRFRGHEFPVSDELGEIYRVSAEGQRYEFSAGPSLPVLRLTLKTKDPSFTHGGASTREIVYEKDADRGYESRGILWSPGYFQFQISPNQNGTVIASADPWDRMLALTPEDALELHDRRCEWLVGLADPKARTSPAADLVLAADQFIIKPVGRARDAARANALGDEVRTVIAGYYWFTDWGRDTMISLEGLTLSTGRYNEAGWILRTFAQYIWDGLIPNMFPEGENKGLYHTADATLWFFHALDRYLAYTDDRQTLKALLPKLLDIIAHHTRGTRFGIHADVADGLLVQGEEGYQLTWMDAKVDGWVVTPRRGKAVEINALWYNAICLLESWVRTEQNEEAARPFAEQANKIRASFNERFWNVETGYLFDVVDGENGNDPACRPNQVIAISLQHPVLDPKYWKPVMNVVREKLLTPVGLRSLSPDHPDYKARYFGDLRSRDAAYHQGTVWGWLAGPFVDAWLKTFPDDRATARGSLEGFVSTLHEACVGSISEVFDAEEPFTPRGCIAQAWSVAEVLRCWIKTAD